MKNIDEAVKQVEAAIDQDPTRSEVYTELASLQLARGKVPEAEAAFKQAVEADPNSANARLALANFYWLNRRPDEAETILKETHAIHPEDLQVNRALAAFYLGSQRAPEAEPYLKAVADVSKDNNHKVGLALYYIAMNRRSEGQSILEEVASGTDDAAATAKARLASLAAADGDRANAYRLIDEALQKQPKHQLALLEKAEFLWQDRKIDDALKTAGAASDADALKHLLLGRIYGSKREWQDAMGALNEALRLNPRLVPAQLELARVQLATGNADAALQTSQAVAKAHLGNSDAQLILARAYIAKGDIRNAEEALRPLKAVGSRSAAVQAHLGLLELMKKKSYESKSGVRASAEAGCEPA
jgi:tetratricopeptide (TPR) repeat protein